MLSCVYGAKGSSDSVLIQDFFRQINGDKPVVVDFCKSQRPQFARLVGLSQQCFQGRPGAVLAR